MKPTHPKATANWEALFQALVAFKENQGHCGVPDRWSENPELGRWVSNQRKTFRKGKLSEERVVRLEALGFEWDPVRADWEAMFQALVAFKENQGHCRVPRKWSENPELGTWVSNQRQVFRKGELSEERVARLEALGFEWDPFTADWEALVQALVAFKENQGHCGVPDKWSENPELGRWVSRQRKTFKKGKLSEERVVRLEALGFEWDPFTADWEALVQALVAFKENQGHCGVPRRWSENPQLGRWVSTQRKTFKKGKLSEERVARLEALGFEWGRIKKHVKE